MRWLCARAQSFEEEEAAHVVDDIGKFDPHGGTGNTESSDEQTHLRFLIGKDMLDARADHGLSGIRCLPFPDEPELPVPDSLASLLIKGYRITTTADYGSSGALFTLFRQKQTVFCVLTAPTSGTDQDVPTLRCWSLNEPTLEEVKK